MAAVAMARRGNRSNTSAHRNAVLIPMPPAELVQFSGSLDKQTTHSGRIQWRNMYCACTADVLAIRRAEGHAMIDCIPMADITKVELQERDRDLLERENTEGRSTVVSGVFASIKNLSTGSSANHLGRALSAKAGGSSFFGKGDTFSSRRSRDTHDVVPGGVAGGENESSEKTGGVKHKTTTECHEM